MRGSLIRSLKFFWRQHAAVAAGCAVASAVLTGALLVGDSMRGSLLQITLERLGSIEQAVVSNSFFRGQLAQDLEADAAGGSSATVAPMLVLSGSARHTGSGTRASGVAVLGVDESFLDLYTQELRPEGWSFGEDSPLPPVILNESLAAELGAAAGDSLLLSFPQTADVPRASILGRRDTGSVLRSLRTEVSAVVPDRGAGSFSLAAHQGTPKNAFLPLARLQEATERPGEVNSLLAGTGGDGASSLDESLRRHLTLEDLGLRLMPLAASSSGDPEAGFPRDPAGDAAAGIAAGTTADTVAGTGQAVGGISVESRQLVLQDSTVREVEALARERGWQSRRVLSYLANSAEVGERSIPYSAIAGLQPESFTTMTAPDGSPLAAPGPGEIVLNAWAAEQLEAEAGDEVRLTYYVVGEREQLSTESATFRVAGVAAMEGLGADPALTPEMPGMHDADDIAAWDPPFPVDLDVIRDEDEQYWDDHRAAPKLFLLAEDAEELWRSRFGAVTAVRLQAPGGGDLQGELEEVLRQELPRRLPLEAFTLSFEPVRQEGMEAAQGATDFAQLFLAFSWFLIVAAALLVALLFSLGVEQRAREVGLLRAVGFPEPRVRRRFLAEGAVVAVMGALAGLAGALGYAALMMAGLRTWWLPAVGSKRLTLHVSGTSLLIGFAVAVVITVLAIFLALRRLKTLTPQALLAGSLGRDAAGGKAGRAKLLALLASVAAVALTVAAVLGDGSAGLAFGAGTAVLVAGLASFAWRSRRREVAAGGAQGLTFSSMASRNLIRNPGRSLLSLSLVAFACFVLVLTALNRRPTEVDVEDPHSGAGGFGLMATSDVPIFEDLSDADGRYELAVGSEGESLLEESEVLSLRTLPGDDASCLNLYRVETPRVLGVPDAFIDRGGFHFQKTAALETEEEKQNPWNLLRGDLGTHPTSGAAILPAVADFETAQWILKKKLGDDLIYRSHRGDEVRLRLVGLIHASIFQSELLVSEENLLAHFPEVEGYQTFLFDTPAEAVEPLGQALEGDLEDFGFDAVTTEARLSSFKAVQNTYLATFQTLGGLGLLLGTLGLAVVLLRNVLERRGELALLQATGFRKGRLRRLVLVENVLLLVWGLLLGSLAAAVAAAPYLLDSLTAAPLTPIAGILLLVFLTGTAACWLATARAMSSELLPALRSL